MCTPTVARDFLEYIAMESRPILQVTRQLLSPISTWAVMTILRWMEVDYVDYVDEIAFGDCGRGGSSTCMAVSIS